MAAHWLDDNREDAPEDVRSGRVIGGCTGDATRNLAAITDPLGHTTTRTYDPVSRLITQTVQVE